MSQQSITVNIANRSYPLKVNTQNESFVRNAAKLINERIAKNKTQFETMSQTGRVLDDQDMLAIAALYFVVELLNKDNKEDQSQLLEAIQSLDKQLGEYIESKIL